MKTFSDEFTNTPYLVMFGLGVQFRECYQQLVLSLGREPDYLCDNAPDKWGKFFFSKKCISPEELCKMSNDTTVVITVRKYEQIYQQLLEIGIKNIFVASFDQGYDIVSNIQRLENGVKAIEDVEFQNSVNGKWTFITGSSRGIGRQIALHMAELGSNIIAHSRDNNHTQKLAGECSAFGVQVMTIAAELANINEIEIMIDRLENYYPPIDIIFNNAAISQPNNWNEFLPQEYLSHYTVNTIAPIRISSRLISGMQRRGYGKIINVSSTIQKRPNESAYACSKAALSKFVYDLAPNMYGTGVTISLVCPGYVRSDMGGSNAPHSVESVIPGVLLGALLDESVNGKYLIAQDYAGLTIPEAIKKAKFYYNLGEKYVQGTV